jgi:hypothetical protein
MHLIKDMIYVGLIFFAVYFGFYLFERHDTVQDKMKRYDCRISEFSPDFPPEIREECRRQSIERINQGKGV